MYLPFMVSEILIRHDSWASEENLLEERCPNLKAVPQTLCSLTQLPPDGISFHILQTLHSINLQEKHLHKYDDSSACEW